jgi:tetratricopeptide (TPR) repeat protein
VGVGLAAAVIAVYAPVAAFDFVNFDDDAYVYGNRQVQSGLTWEGIRWAFTSVSYFYWQPLTWISHMIDCEFFGLTPGPHHVVNVVLHILNSTLLFAALRVSTGALWRSAAVAGIFALHQTRVESVAWIAERKDVLAGLFWMLALLAYALYVRDGSPRRYPLVLGAMLGGVMAKPSIVTLPFVLLILDWWPLRRSGPWRRLVVEKIPLFTLSAVSSLLTYVGQEQMGATRLTSELSLPVRLANALISYAWYLFTFVWPYNLSVLYPYQRDISALAVSGAAAALAAVTVFAVLRIRKQPYILAGWLWFIGTLVPVIGLIQAGSQARADRFTYIPLIGLAMASVWGAAELLSRWRAGAKVALCVFMAAVLALGSRTQVAYWRDSITLFEHAVAVTENNPVAQHNLGHALAAKGRFAEALPHYREALRGNPGHAEGHYNLGRAQWSIGQSVEAMHSMKEAIRLSPGYADAHFSLATVALRSNDEQTAVLHYQEALKLGLSPEYAAEAHNDLGVLAARRGTFEQAELHFRSALALRPEFTRAQQNLANVIAQQRGRVSAQ